MSADELREALRAIRDKKAAAMARYRAKPKG
jgi:hypothetical protein